MREIILWTFISLSICLGLLCPVVRLYEKIRKPKPSQEKKLQFLYKNQSGNFSATTARYTKAEFEEKYSKVIGEKLLKEAVPIEGSEKGLQDD